jgi:hypothetical protein
MQALSQLSYTPLFNQAERRTGTETDSFRRCSVTSNVIKFLAEWTGLEPATPGVTGRYSNQLNYHSLVVTTSFACANQVPSNLASPRGFEPL